MEVYTYSFFAFAAYITVLFGIIAGIGYLFGVFILLIVVTGHSEMMGNIIFLVYNFGYFSFWYYADSQDKKDGQKNKKNIGVFILQYLLVVALSFPYIATLGGVCVIEKRYLSDDDYTDRAIRSLAENMAMYDGYVTEDEYKNQDIRYKEIVQERETKIRKYISTYPQAVQITRCRWCIGESEAPITVRIAYFYNDKEARYINEYLNTVKEIPPKREVTGYLEVDELTVCGKKFETIYGDGVQAPLEGYILQGSKEDIMLNPISRK